MISRAAAGVAVVVVLIGVGFAAGRFSAQNEPTTTNATRPAAPGASAAVTSPVGRSPPLQQLVPVGSTDERSWFFPRLSRFEPAHVLVTWRRSRGPLAIYPLRGLALWSQSGDPDPVGWWKDFGLELHWEFVNLEVKRGDVTGDRRPEVLLVHSNDGTGYCGPRRLLQMYGGFRELLSRYTCDTSMELRGGALHIGEGVYRDGDAHCCPTLTRQTVIRWREGRAQVLRNRLVRNING